MNLATPRLRDRIRATLLVLTVLTLGWASARVQAEPRNNIRFTHLNRADGLSQAAVNVVFQDRHGFMWFGTEDGLNRYDGRRFTVFKHDSLDPQSLSHNFVWAIEEDDEGALWIASYGGLNRRDPARETFEHFKHDPDDPTSLSSDRVRTLFRDHTGTLWIGTDGGGLNRFDPESRSFTRFGHDPEDPETLSHDWVRAIHQDRDGVFWIGTFGGGLNRFDPQTGRFVRYRHDPEDPATLGHDEVSAIEEDRQGRLWIGTYQGGLSVLDRRSGRFERLSHDPQDPSTLSHDRVVALHEDAEGTMWVATQGGGLNEWQPESQSFNVYRHSLADPRSLNSDELRSLYQDRGGVLWIGTQNAGLNKWDPITNLFTWYGADPQSDESLGAAEVRAIFEDRSGRLWVGTRGGGLDVIDRGTGEYTHFRHDPGDPHSLSDDRVMSLLVDDRGVVWAGTMEGGLNRLDPDTGRFRRIEHDPEDATSLASNGIMSLLQDSRGDLWVGMFEGGVGRLDRETGTLLDLYRQDDDDPSSLSRNRPAVLFEDSTGTLWVGTDLGGLNRFDRETETFTVYRHDPEDPSSLSSDQVWSLYEDPEGALWVGTGGDGLNRWDPEDRRADRTVFERYSERSGLPNGFVYGILPGGDGSLWVSTNNGISRFDPEAETFKNYNSLHGLQSDEFAFGAYHRSQSGELFFGGINGLNAFFPERLRNRGDDRLPPLVLTSFRRNNQEVDLPGSLVDVDSVEVGWRDYLVSFEFAALDYAAPQNNQYAYKLEGFDKEWIRLGTRNQATFTNLPGGEYTFRVRGSNNDGSWNEEGLAIGVTVITPPWRRWWAYTLYFLAGFGLLFTYTGVHRARLRREELYARRLERQVEERTLELAEKNQQLEEAAITDALTGLRNRHYLLTEIQKELQESADYFEAVQTGAEVPLPPTLRRITEENDRRHTTEPSYLFLMIDLDGFKPLNDNHGHAAGDRALVCVSRILQSCFRESDSIIRWGGDEFLIVCRNVDRTSGQIISERIRRAISSFPFEGSDDSTVELQCSIGFAFYPFCRKVPSHLSGEQVLNLADRVMYVAKRSGRDGWVGLHSTERTIEEPSLLQRVNDDLPATVDRGVVRLEASFERHRLTLGWADELQHH